MEARDQKQLEDLQAMKEASRFYRPPVVCGELKKSLLGKTKTNIIVYEVDGNFIRSCLDIGFALGGHWLVKPYMPQKEVWVEKLIDAKDQCANLSHELKEVSLMIEGNDYEQAHEKASKYESEIRAGDGQLNEVISWL